MSGADLIGRDAERKRLKDAIGAPSVRIVRVVGPSGAGKTALVEATLADAREGGAIVGAGKYAQGVATGAFIPILAALSGAVGAALELLYDPSAGAETLRKQLGPQIAVLAGAGLNIAGITSTPPDPLPTLGRANAARIVEASLALLHWLAGFGAPIVLFIDDWQRAPKEVRGIVSAITREDLPCTLILGERADDEIALLAAADDDATVEIVLDALQGNDRARLLEATTGKAGAGPVIADWLSDTFSGLPFDLMQAANALQDGGALVERGGAWTIDATRAAGIDRADFSGVFVRRLRQLPEDVLSAGTAVALWGDAAPVGLIADALNEDVTATRVRLSQLEHIGVLALSDNTVRLLHDQLRSALLDAMSAAARQALAGRMSERMAVWPSLTWPTVQRTALHMRLLGGLKDASPEVWRDRFAAGALAARSAADTASATEFADAAWTLRRAQKPDDRGLDILLLREAVFAAGMRHDRAALIERAGTLFASANADAWRGEAYEAAILAARQMGEGDLAWRWAREGFAALGIRIPENASLAQLAWWTLRWRLQARKTVQEKSIEAESDPLMRIVSISGVIAYESNPRNAILIALKASVHAARRGYRDPAWLAADVFAHANLGQKARAAALGEVIVKYAGQSKFSPATTLYHSAFFGAIWGRPLRSLVEYGETTYQWSMAEGDMVGAAVAVRNDALLAWHCSPSLDAFQTRLAEDARRADRLADERAVVAMQEFKQFADSLQSADGFAATLDYTAHITGLLDAWGTPVAWVQMLALRGEWAALADFCDRLIVLRGRLNSHPGSIIWRFLESLARHRLDLAPRKGDLEYVREGARLNPTDHRAKLLLLEAEQHRAKGERTKAVEAYTLAVEFAAKGSSRPEEGLIAEAAALGLRLVGESVLATRQEQHAREVWLRWGARAKLGSEPRETSETSIRVAEAESQAASAMRSERAKSRFLAEVAHELRTPLQAMQGLIELASAEPSESRMRELRDVLGSLRNVVDDLTELEALGAGAPLNPQPTNIADLLAAEGAAFSALARAKGLDFALTTEPSSEGWYSVDASRLRQIVRNLLSNAVKYVERGNIAVKAEVVSLAGGRVRFSIAVEDTGPGIREADLARLFEPFERGGRSSGGGLGLGLALSRRIAERMEGELVVENLAPHGARFRLTFLAVPANPAAIVLPASAVPAKRLLLVEDVALNRRVVAAMLKRDGHDVAEAASGAEAIDLCLRSRFDLIFLDLGLPDMDGLEVLRRLRDSGSTTPVIVLTASALPATKEKSLEAGAIATLRKPVTGDELRAAIVSTLGFSHAPNEPVDTFEQLSREARDQIAIMARDIVADPGVNLPALRVKAHRLSGLAAQFAADDIAAVADKLDATAHTAAEAGPLLQELKQALAAFERQ
ncbi:MAG TPA: response regulator [Rhizomicrobium sp.]|jgi:signal transduction histidine kinase/CheY-like chemotaxis protein|nr:response regulator [Rhizomicrobium sp.]